MHNSEKLYKGHYAMLNNNQLTIAIDSLQLKHQEKKELFRQNIKDKYTKNLILDSKAKSNAFQTNKNQQYDIAINKTRTITSIIRSNNSSISSSSFDTNI